MADKMIEVEDKEVLANVREYFEKLKAAKRTITVIELDEVYDNCLVLLDKYQITGQTDAMKKLLFHMETLEKEKDVIEAGIDTFVYLHDIKEYIEKVPQRVVKIIELKRYEREVPDEVLENFAKVKDLFTEFFVVFTDYTKEHEKKHKKETDPILFGMFKDMDSASVVERMYYIGDWEDEYCDLTLDRMVSEMKQATGKNIERITKYPRTMEELKEQLGQMVPAKRAGFNSGDLTISSSTGVNMPNVVLLSSDDVRLRKPFTSKVKDFLTRKKGK